MDCTRHSTVRSVRRVTRLAALGLLLSVGLAGCVDPREVDRPFADASDQQGCFDCHGTEANGNSAPPPAIWQGVGVIDAHQAHLQGGEEYAPVPCESCHEVPERVLEEGHIDTDLPAEVIFAGVAVANGADPTFANGTCENTYCHGGALVNGGGSLTNPPWSLAGGNPVECGTCHGLPPGPPHPPAEDCERCHGAVVDADGFIRPDLHVNGVVELSVELACDSCHGEGGDPAPPPSTTGDEETTARGVGAHQMHLSEAGGWHAPVECAACHVVPEEVQEEGHIDTGLPAEVVFAGLAVANDAEPTWDAEAETCAGTYCHGGTLGDPAAGETEPQWTLVDGSQAECGTCHGLPPGGGHPPRADCESCHSAVVAADAFVDPALHIDGQVQIDDLGCDGCHGGGGDPAPPVDVNGNSETTFGGVGAHQAHLGAAGWHAEIECSECHLVPEDTLDEGHIDTPLPAELVFGDLAAANGVTPEYDRESTTCSGTWCHGSGLEEASQGSNTVPDWTLVDGSQAECGTCHSLPPGGDHPPREDCATCHGEVIGEDGFVDAALHIDGTVQLSELQCDSCHGQNGNPAPPFDTHGERSVRLATVGAHRAHLGESEWHAELACTECHTVPDEIDDPGHIDETPRAELVWGALATDEGAEPVYDEIDTTCSDTYCHGSTLSEGGSLTTPTWTALGQGQAACGTCHGLPPGGSHPDRDDCATCHGPVINAARVIIRPDLHINGTVDIE